MRVAIAHINRDAVKPLDRIIAQIDPMSHSTILLDEQPLKEINAAGRITGQAMQGFAKLLFEIDSDCYDGILIGCSMFSAKESVFKSFFDIPLVGLDQPMIRHVAATYRRVGVLATNRTACSMTSEQILAAGADRKVEVSSRVVSETEGYLKVGDLDSYTNALWKGATTLMDDQVDIIVLAQVSMTVTESRLQGLSIPVISSARLGLSELQRLIAA